MSLPILTCWFQQKSQKKPKQQQQQRETPKTKQNNPTKTISISSLGSDNFTFHLAVFTIVSGHFHSPVFSYLSLFFHSILLHHFHHKFVICCFTTTYTRICHLKKVCFSLPYCLLLLLNLKMFWNVIF